MPTSGIRALRSPEFIVAEENHKKNNAIILVNKEHRSKSMPGKKSLQASMASHDIPGVSKATVIDGKIEYQALGTTSCGFYKKALKPQEHEYNHYDSSRHLSRPLTTKQI